ncbi:NAD(P)-binding protein [Coniochaeta ligniaria NRRL 30616]|uniref:NAD(P)-binding protein n=1 Tax=Coniochaeta ligniaria NRRL 30616 TaxID=1408157 RepID=A0A1J7IVX6_9PEZI|nr:NAD(P)-binding protein [Coniochaeta ligniaria NRRL 30616]
MTTPQGGFDISPLTHTSGPIDLSLPYTRSTLAHKSILITGGASGLGAAFARHWAAHGAHITIADVDVSGGETLVAELHALPGSSGHHLFCRCDVTVWEDQLRLFRTAAAASPRGGIDAVVANAGIPERDSAVTGRGFENPVGLDQDGAPAPPLRVLRTNMIGVAYTCHLAMFWLPRNRDPQYRKSGAGGGGEADERERDRHLLLIGSVAGITPLPGQPEYCAAKHGVTGLFRALAGSTFRHGVRVNLLLPYFTDTPLVPWQGMMFLAGAGLARVADVVEAGTRLMADEGIVGRALGVTAPVEVVGDGEDGEVRVVGGGERRGEAIWEVFAHDHEHVEVFVWRYVRLMNALLKVRGWVGFMGDLVRFAWFRRREESRREQSRREQSRREQRKRV